VEGVAVGGDAQPLPYGPLGAAVPVSPHVPAGVVLSACVGDYVSLEAAVQGVEGLLEAG